MPVLHRDIETDSDLDLRESGAWRYAADPSTTIVCIAFAVDDGPVRLWLPGQPIPSEFYEAARNPDWLVCAHNDFFESAIEERILAPQLGWPLVPLARHRCTLSMTLAAALPGKLESVAKALALPQQKDKAGRYLLQKMRRGQKLTKEELEQLYAYCRQDIEVERALYKRLLPLSAAEQELWTLDRVINRRGFFIDRTLAAAACEIEQKERKTCQQKLAELTNGRVTSIHQVARIKNLLKEHGCETKSLDKDALKTLQAPDDTVRSIIELRRDGAKASKLKALLAGLDADNRMRGTLQFSWCRNRQMGRRPVSAAEFEKDRDRCCSSNRGRRLRQHRARARARATAHDRQRDLARHDLRATGSHLDRCGFQRNREPGAGVDRWRAMEARRLPALRRNRRFSLRALLRDGKPHSRPHRR
jgi:DNA polymerase